MVLRSLGRSLDENECVAKNEDCEVLTKYMNAHPRYIYLIYIVDVSVFTANFASNLLNGLHDFYNCKIFASSIEDDILGDIRTKIEAKIRNCEDMIEVPSTSHQHKNSQIVQERSA